MKKSLLCPTAILIFILVLTACGNPPATSAVTQTQAVVPTATISEASTLSPTPDPCARPQVEQEVQKVHKHMREFDDAANLASNIAREQLSDSIADLQRIRREAEDELIPECLTKLKTYQIQHMELVIGTLIAFMGGTTDQQTLNQGIAAAGNLHDQYVTELARLLGLTPVVATAPAAPSETPTP